MELLIAAARESLDKLKAITKRLTEIDKLLKESKLNDADLYGEQFRLFLDINKEADKMNDILLGLECDEQTMFIAKRFRRQAEALTGEKITYGTN